MSRTYPTKIFARKVALTWAPLVAAALLTGQTATAQPAPPAGSSSTPATRKAAGHRVRPDENPSPAEQSAPTPPVPEPPHWPVNDSPSKPSVTWDASGLKIQANNASLHDILNEVSTDTGAKVEGMGTDERVFGDYGPGTARDVLSQLLHGSSYNVLMIGDQGEGTPRQIVLSARRSGPPPSQANRPTPQDQPDEDVPDQPEVDEQPPMQPPNGRPPMQQMQQGPPGAPRTPQQMLQELQQRQQLMQQIQDQQQQQQQH